MSQLMNASSRAGRVLFTTVIIGTAVIVVALTYLPALALGPIIGHIRMVTGG